MNLADIRAKLARPKTVVLPIHPYLPFQWKQGEHLAIVGRTGSGKTTVANVLLHARKSTLSIRTKADDAPLPGKYIKRGGDFGKGDDLRYVLDVHRLNPPQQEREILAALERVWKQKAWTVYADELYYMQTRTKVAAARIEGFLTQGRSMGITNMVGMQRPVHSTRFALSESTHVICFAIDGRDSKVTLRDAVGDKFAETVADLGRYEFAWYHVPTRAVWRGRVQQLLGAEPVGA